MSNCVKYTVNFDDANQHIYTIELAIPAHSEQQLTLTLPSWLPGSYMIRDFAKNIVTISSTDDIKISPVDKQSWHVITAGQACIITYQVYALDESVRTAFLDQHRAFFNGTSVFISVVEMQSLPHQVELEAPAFAPEWLVATGLPRMTGTEKYQFGQFIAIDYHHLIDCPFEITDFDHIEFNVAGVNHHFILSGKHYADMPRLARDVTKLCLHHMDLFAHQGDNTPPFSEYWFLTNILPNGFGGLEHKNSTALLCSTFDFPNVNQPDQTSSNYQTLLSLVSHEYFHAWNVCRIKPKAFIPYQLDQESYTTQLWAYEGITSYYDDFSLYRTGLITFEQYLELLSKTMSRVNRGAGQTKQDLLQSSFYTWTKFYQQGSDAQNNIVSYYTKGSLVALWLDLTLRTHTNNQYSLDDVMRQLWQQYGRVNIGTEADSVINIVNQLIGQDISEPFNQLLSAKLTVPLQSLFEKVGISEQKIASDVNNPLKQQTNPNQNYVGLTPKACDFGVKVLSIAQDSPAELAGVSAGDQLIAIDKLVVSMNNYTSVIDNLSVETSYSIDLIRQGQLVTKTLTVRSSGLELTKLNVKDNSLVKIWQQ